MLRVQKIFILSYVTTLLLFGCASLDGGTEAGNPSSVTNREVLGVLSSTSSPNLTLYLDSDGTGCEADTVIATDTDQIETAAMMASDCSFSLDLETRKVYSFSFEKNGAFVALMEIQDSEEAFSTLYLLLSDDSDEPIDLGEILIDGNVATPATQASEQIDTDGDGVSDFEDSDDDGDGIEDDADEDVEDCDLDGLADIYDSDTSTCSDDTDSGEETGTDTGTDSGEETGGDSGTDSGFEIKILQVSPLNGSGIINSLTISLTQSVRVRFNCPIDESTVTSSTFTVTGEAGDVIGCSYALLQDNHVVNCQHDSDSFLPLAIYTATVDGIACETGETIESHSWQWMTLNSLL